MEQSHIPKFKFGPTWKTNQLLATNLPTVFSCLNPDNQVYIGEIEFSGDIRFNNSCTTCDLERPTVTLSNQPASISGTQPFVVTYTFSESVLNFDQVADIVVTGGTSTAPTGSGNFYTSIITPSGNGDVSVEVPEGVAVDLFKNPNSESGTLVVTNTIIEDTQKAIASFIQSRTTHLLNNQPDIAGFIDGSNLGGGGSLGNFGLTANTGRVTTSFSSSLGRIWSEAERNQSKAMGSAAQPDNAAVVPTGTDATAYGLTLAPEANQPVPGQADANASPLAEHAPALADRATKQEQSYGSTAGLDASDGLTAAQRRGYDMWVQVNGSQADAGDSDSSLWVGYFGGHVFVNPNFLIGALVQADWAEETNSTLGSSADGFGWMVGPYIAAKSAEHNLFFDARAAWGQSDNDLKMKLAGSTGSFDTERWLVNAKLSGLIESNGWSIRPAVSIAYFEETQESYTDSLTNPIPEQTFSQGEVRFGPTFSYDVVKDNGTTIRPTFGVSGVWNFDVDNNLNSQGAVLGTGDVRARIDAGFTAITMDRWSFDISGFYDGLGVDDYDAYGGSAKVTIPLQ